MEREQDEERRGRKAAEGEIGMWRAEANLAEASSATIREDVQADQEKLKSDRDAVVAPTTRMISGLAKLKDETTKEVQGVLRVVGPAPKPPRKWPTQVPRPKTLREASNCNTSPDASFLEAPGGYPSSDKTHNDDGHVNLATRGDAGDSDADDVTKEPDVCVVTNQKRRAATAQRKALSCRGARKANTGPKNRVAEGRGPWRCQDRRPQQDGGKRRRPEKDRHRERRSEDSPHH